MDVCRENTDVCRENTDVRRENTDVRWVGFHPLQVPCSHHDKGKKVFMISRPEDEK